MSNKIQLTLTVKEAYALSMAISDILCWIRGYRAAAPEFDSNGPIDSDNLIRDFNTKLCSAYTPAIKFGEDNV